MKTNRYRTQRLVYSATNESTEHGHRYAKILQKMPAPVTETGDRNASAEKNLWQKY